MKTLILYATKHGAAREIAQKLAARMDDATVIDLGGGAPAPAPDGYDCVVVGSSVYAGQLGKDAKAYVAQHADALKQRPLGLFISGLAPDGALGYAQANYPKDVAEHAKAIEMLGGVFDPSKENFLERLVMRIIIKTSKYKSTISDEKIDQFAQSLRS